MNTPTQKNTGQPDRIDQEIHEFIVRLDDNYKKLTSSQTVTPSERRTIAEKARKEFRIGGPKMAQTETVAFEGKAIRARVYTPQHPFKSGSGQPVLLYIHGGGWVMFSIDTHDRLMREYADKSGFTVIGVDYSLSPENRFPQALDDIDTVYNWVFSNAETYGWSMEQIYIGGDSAGGNLSLCSTLRRRDSEMLMPKGILLNYAALDTEFRPSYNLYDGEPFVLTQDEMAAFWDDYIGAPNTENPYARPLLADLIGLPSVYMCIAECDILRDENLELYERLVSAGVDVSSIVYRGATHSFLEAMSVSSLAKQAIHDASDWLRSKVI